MSSVNDGVARLRKPQHPQLIRTVSGSSLGNGAAGDYFGNGMASSTSR